MTLLLDAHGAQVHRADWRALLDVVPRCDALIVDAPYSERTHAGHDDGTAQANRMADWIARGEGRAWDRTYASRQLVAGVPHRRKLTYPAWAAEDVTAFVEAWHPRVSGWLVSLTDHVLAPAWEAALLAVGRYVFAPLACVEPGSRVRMTGDGPTNWSCWAVVARPKTATAARWGALPGAYVTPAVGLSRIGSQGKSVVGGKPLWLMERLIEDYSRPGDLIVDPCCGAGTTAVAAIRTGRRAIVGDVLKEHAELAAARVARPQQQPLFAVGGE